MPGPLMKGRDGLWYEQRGLNLVPYAGITPDMMERAQGTASEMGALGAAGMSILDTLGGGYWIPGAADVDPNQYRADIQAMRGQHPIASAAGAIGASIPGAILGGPTIAGQMFAGGAMGALADSSDPLAGALTGGAAGGGTMAAFKGIGAVLRRPAANMSARIQNNVDIATLPNDPAFMGTAATRVSTLDDLGRVAAEDMASAAGDMPGQPALTMGGVSAPYVSPRHQSFIDMANRAGFKLLPGQEMNSRALRQVEAAMESNPILGATVLHPIQAGNQAALNRIVNEAMARSLKTGEALSRNLDEVGPEAIGNFRTKLQNVFGRVYNDAGPVPARDVISAFQPVMESLQGQTYGAEKLAKIIMSRASGGIFSPAELSATRNFLSAQQRALAADAGRRVESGMYGQMVDALDNTVLQRVGPDGMGELHGAMQGWRLLKALERPAVVSEKGNVATGPLYRSILKSYRDNVTQAGKFNPSALPENMPGGLPGQADAMGKLVDAVRAAEYFKGTIGDSGTATRLAYKDFLDMSMLGAATKLASPLLARAYLGGMRTETGRRAAEGAFNMANQARGVFEAGLQ